MGRRLIIASVVGGIVLFVAISLMLARAFNAESAERAAVTDIVKTEARGDVGAATTQIDGCIEHSACRARIAANVAKLHRPGNVEVLQLEPSTGFSLSGSTGTARIAFRIGGGLPTVQCVRVRRRGNVVSGLSIELLAVSAPLTGDAACGPSGP